MLLQSGCVLLRQVATSSVRNFPNCWNCVVRIPEGNHFHFFKRSFTSRSFQTNVFSSVSVKFNRHGQKFAILTNCARFRSTNVKSQDGNWKDRLWYSLAVAIFMTGATILSVPLYRVFCQKSGRGGKAVVGDNEKVESMKPQDRLITVKFNADRSAQMQWDFKPQQREIQVRVGETALAFYNAKNPTDKPIIGISTYTIVPWQAGYYFNKIQCFCFEEQRLNPGEEVEMPVFFYLDPDLLDDPRMDNVDDIVLSYTFFSSKDQEVKYPGQQIMPANAS
ncbi:cytochrome c oxidase assembly protein ctaG-like [Crassostrea virginica]